MTIFKYNDDIRYKNDRECNRIINGALQMQKPSFNKNLTKVDIWKISSTQLENLIKEHLNIKFDFVANEEVGNHYTPFFGMKPKQFTTDQDKYASRYIQNLIYLGVLEPGNYLVDHSW